MVEIKIMVSETIALEIAEAIQRHATMWCRRSVESPVTKNWAYQITDTLGSIADQIEQQITDSQR